MLKKSILSILTISILIWSNSCRKRELENPTNANLITDAKNYVDSVFRQQNANSFAKRMNFQIQWNKAIVDSANNLRVPVSFNLENLKPKDGKQILTPSNTNDVFELYIKEDKGKIEASIMQFMSVKGKYYPIRYTLTGERKTKFMVGIPTKQTGKIMGNVGSAQDRLLLSSPNTTMIYESEFLGMIKTAYGSNIDAVVIYECQLGSYFNATTCACEMSDFPPTGGFYPELFIMAISNSGTYQLVPYPFSFHPSSVDPDPEYPDGPIGGGGGDGGGNPGGGNTPQAILANKLDLILEDGDSYEFNSSVNSNLTFNSVVEFKNYLNSNKELSNINLEIPETVISEQTKVVHAKFNLVFIGGVAVDVQLTKDTNNIWQFSSVTSDTYGVTLAWSWTHNPLYGLSYNNSINYLYLTVGGTANYNIVVESFGTVYKQRMEFKIVINQTTGKIVQISRLL
jgi:hypothetical protein